VTLAWSCGNAPPDLAPASHRPT